MIPKTNITYKYYPLTVPISIDDLGESNKAIRPEVIEQILQYWRYLMDIKLSDKQRR